MNNDGRWLVGWLEWIRLVGLVRLVRLIVARCRVDPARSNIETKMRAVTGTMVSVSWG